MYEDNPNDEVWIHGRDEESGDRQCPNCGNAVDPALLTEPEGENGVLLCPECQAELPWTSVRDIPVDDWFNWACLERITYPARSCFHEPDQRALSLAVSLADPRGADLGLEISKTEDGDILVKVDNREGLTYYPYVGTKVEGSYTLVRFRRN